MNAHQATCPITKRLLFFDPEDPDSYTDIQSSRMNCHPLSIFEGEETKDTCFWHKPQFDFFLNSCKTAGPDNPFPDWQPFTISVELDMKGSWEGSFVGEGVKRHAQTCPCQQCATISDELHVPNANLCPARWCQKLHAQKEGWECHHHEIITPERVTQMKTKVDSLKQMLSVCIEEIIVQSKMKVEDADKPQKTSQSNPKSIHFIPQTLTEKVKFSNLLTRELLLRELPAMGDITLRRERLRDALRRERFLRRLQKQIKHGT
eukprot:scaffold1230_cov33-Attheya_sp.AAC.1